MIRLRRANGATTPSTMRESIIEVIANTTPQEMAIQCRIPKLRLTTLPANCRVGRTAKTVGASTKAKKMSPPIHTTSDSSIKYLTKDIATSGEQPIVNGRYGTRRRRNLPQREKERRDGSLFSRAGPSRSAAEHRATIDVEDFAGNVPRPIGAEEHDGIGYVISQRNTLQRNRLLDFVLVSVGTGPEDGIVQLGVNPARRDAIHADVGRQL